ncbi:MAG: TylF/MycF family methyltransferase [Sandaracinaceae bacterium]|nr:TylF/MycF family methyltransferase [Sandaracinaceae bacterium]
MITPLDVLRRLRHGARRLSRKRLVDGPLTFAEDGLATQHSTAFLEDPRFVRAYAAGKATGSWGGADIHWRAQVACWAGAHAARLEGDFVECGVNRGGLARAIIEFVGAEAFRSRRFYLLDTFHGLVEAQISDEDRAMGRREGGYEECYDAVVDTFRPFPFVEVVRGTVPDTLPRVTSERISFLSIDMNCVPPEIAAAEAFWPRLVRGAVVLLDDYNFVEHQPQRVAFDAFARARDVVVLPMPTGQGILLKP